ncbi:4713_t:CDS:2 [Ambispora gerdemannii]|uniref:4713_t:CDS:1 n=1 Tax=Ambispora gerdemannii TaxID=144530 RepID=A0A9N9DPW8_9GLOM|nr:4713_t:CDS:2 [Ambispora gerdemannii]
MGRTEDNGWNAASHEEMGSKKKRIRQRTLSINGEITGGRADGDNE